MFENVDGRTDGRRTDGRRSDWYTISSPMSKAHGELIKNQNKISLTRVSPESMPRHWGLVWETLLSVDYNCFSFISYISRSWLSQNVPARERVFPVFTRD